MMMTLAVAAWSVWTTLSTNIWPQMMKVWDWFFYVSNPCQKCFLCSCPFCSANPFLRKYYLILCNSHLVSLIYKAPTYWLVIFFSEIFLCQLLTLRACHTVLVHIFHCDNHWLLHVISKYIRLVLVVMGMPLFLICCAAFPIKFLVLSILP